MHPKDRAQMMAYLTRPGKIKVAQLDNVNTPDLDQTPDSILRPGETLEDFDVTFRRPNADGGRVPFAKGKMPVSVALEEIAKEQGTNFNSVDELQKLVADKVGYTPNKKILRPGKYPILKNFEYEVKKIPFTDEEIKNFIEKNPKYKDASESKIRELISSRKSTANLSNEQKQIKKDRTKEARAARSSEQIALENEKAALRAREKRGDLPKYHKGIRPENRLWSDFIRSAESKDGYFKFKNFVPQKGKKYNKTETEAITLVDRKGNEFKFKSLIDDINKFSGYKADDVLLPYKQVEFLSTQGLTKELSKLAGIQPGSRQAVFNVQHIDGIARNPFNVMLTFADQNLAEAGSRRTFNAEFKNADTLAKKKAAVKKFYSRLGPDIATKLGKKEVGTRPTLETLLNKAGVKLTNEQREAVRRLNIPKGQEGFVARELVENAAKGIGRFGRTLVKYGVAPEIAFVGAEAAGRTLLGEKPTDAALKSIDTITFGATDFTSGIEAKKFGEYATDKLAVDKFKESQFKVNSLQKELTYLKDITDQGGEGYVGDLNSYIKNTQAQLKLAEQELQKNYVNPEIVEFIDRKAQEIADAQMAKSTYAKQSLQHQMKGIPTVKDYMDTEPSRMFPKQPSQMDLNLKMFPTPLEILTLDENLKIGKKNLSEASLEEILKDTQIARFLDPDNKNLYQSRPLLEERNRLRGMLPSQVAQEFSPEQAYGASGIFGGQRVRPTPLYDFAEGGVASGPPPESGPNPQGLPSLLKRVKNL